MGCFNVACSVSNISISEGTECVYIPLVENRYRYKIGDGNHLLIYPWCFYEPATLPIFGQYDSYGRLENIVRDYNVEVIEKFFEIEIDTIFDDFPKPVSSGMFVHKEIFLCLVSNQIDEWGKTKGDFVNSRNKLYKAYDSYSAALHELEVVKEQTSDEFAVILKELSLRKALSSRFEFRNYEIFNSIYRPYIADKKFKKELVDFVLFESGMFSTNSFYFPAMNGLQHGNHYMSEKLYQKSLEVVRRAQKQ